MLVKMEHMKDVCQIIYAKALKKRQELFNSQSLTTDFLKEITISLFLSRTLVNIYSKIILSFKL